MILALCFAMVLEGVSGHIVEGGDIDPTHSHDGFHGGEYPFHTHDPVGPEGHVHTTPSTSRDVEDITLSIELETPGFLLSESFVESYGAQLIVSYQQRIAQLTREISDYADAANHPFAVSRGYYNRSDPEDPTMQWIATRYLHIVEDCIPPLPYNPLEHACEHATCEVPSNNNNPNQTQCRVFGETYGMIQCVCTTRQQGLGPFFNSYSSCHECNSDPYSDMCVKCGDSAYLHLGECIQSCPPNTTPVGTGRFNRECVPHLCIENENSCGVCNEQNTRCTRCRHGRYLHNGECLEVCPEGFLEEGVGNWGKLCVPDGCIPNKRGCKTCTADREACTRCAQYKALYDGECVDECPPGFELKPGYNPNSRYNRECIEELPVSACRSSENNCETCDGGSGATAGLYGDRCVKCRNSRYLHNGECIATCPAGYSEVGTGRWNRICRPNVR